MVRYSKIRKYDVSNWDGINATIFFSGCRFNCKGCFNKAAQSFEYGEEFTDDVIDNFITMARDPKIDNVCMLGGEVFQQDLYIIFDFVTRLKNEVGKPIIVWTGYTIEELEKIPMAVKILGNIDYLIDGRFVLELKDLSLKHRGSSNQRIIDLKKDAQFTSSIMRNI